MCSVTDLWRGPPAGEPVARRYVAILAARPRCSRRWAAAAGWWWVRTPARCGWPRPSAPGPSDRRTVRTDLDRPLRPGPPRARPAGPAGLRAPPTDRDHRAGVLVGRPVPALRRRAGVHGRHRAGRGARRAGTTHRARPAAVASARTTQGARVGEQVQRPGPVYDDAMKILTADDLDAVLSLVGQDGLDARPLNVELAGSRRVDLLVRTRHGLVHVEFVKDRPSELDSRMVEYLGPDPPPYRVRTPTGSPSTIIGVQSTDRIRCPSTRPGWSPHRCSAATSSASTTRPVRSAATPGPRPARTAARGGRGPPTRRPSRPARAGTA